LQAGAAPHQSLARAARQITRAHFHSLATTSARSTTRCE
jgi:hypothetical protein